MRCHTCQLLSEAKAKKCWHVEEKECLVIVTEDVNGPSQMENNMQEPQTQELNFCMI